MTFLMPVLAGVTCTAGLELTYRLGFPIDNPRIIAALVVTGLLAVQGFSLLLPTEIRVFQQRFRTLPHNRQVLPEETG